MKMSPKSVNSWIKTLPNAFEISDSETFTQPRCPVCESMDVAFQELVVPVAFGSFLLNSAVRVTRAAWICHTCRHQWENPDDDLYNGDWLDWRLIHSLWFFNFTVGLVLLGGFFEGQSFSCSGFHLPYFPRSS